MEKDNSKTFKGMSINDLFSASLKSISQVILVENSISGLIILMGITIADYRLGIVALVSAIIGNLVGTIGGVDKTVIDRGLLGYNSVLTGLAVSLFLAGNTKYGIAFFGAGFAAIFTAAMMHFFKRKEIPALTFPYVVLTWFFLLASYYLKGFHLSPDLVPQDLSKWELIIKGPIDFIGGSVSGIGQVYFQNNFWAGILIALGVFWDNWKLGIYIVLGTVIGWLTAYTLLAEHTVINLGLYGYNAVLTIIAVSAVFDIDRPFAKITGCIAAIITVPFTAGIHTLLAIYGLPVLTMPFVLVTWIFLGARKVLPKL